jgi:hypothetical protein
MGRRRRRRKNMYQTRERVMYLYDFLTRGVAGRGKGCQAIDLASMRIEQDGRYAPPMLY